MIMQTQREQIAEYGRRMLESGMTHNTGGYISACDRSLNAIAISPSGMDYMKIRAEDVVVCDFDGNKLDGELRPSSEWGIQLAIYKAREDINAVVHAHSPFATTISALRWELPAANFTLCGALGNVRCSEFYNYTTPEIAQSVVENLKDRLAVLMANHGLVACGASLAEAYALAVEVEFSSEVFWRAKCIGEPIPLTDAQMREMIGESHKYNSVVSENR